MSYIATKQEERDALKQIKAIVENLGENSYVGTAFAGCFEVAEENIANDFGCSLLARATRAEEQLEELIGRFSDEKKLHDEQKAKLEAAYNQAKEQIHELNKQIPSIPQLKALDAFLTEIELETKEAEKTLSINLLNSVSDVNSERFIGARSAYLACEKRLEAMQELRKAFFGGTIVFN